MTHDHSTLDMTRLHQLPQYTLPPTYQLQREPGNGCFLDPPGYPTYYSQNVYTQYGNSPVGGPQMVIMGHVIEHADDWSGCADWDTYSAKRDKRIKSLYKPLPLEHPRVQAWIQALAKHLHTCYIDDSKGPRDNDHTLIFPVPSYKLRSFHDDPRFSDEWRKTEQAAVECENKECREQAAAIAIMDNHSVVRHVRAVYPDYTSTLDHLNHLATLPHVGDWWERYAERPTPDTCRGI